MPDPMRSGGLSHWALNRLSTLLRSERSTRTLDEVRQRARKYRAVVVALIVLTLLVLVLAAVALILLILNMGVVLGWVQGLIDQINTVRLPWS